MNTPSIKATYTKAVLALSLGAVIGFGGMSACASLDRTAESDITASDIPSVTSTRDTEAFSRALDELDDRRVIFVGETHTKYSHHLNQLAVIRELHRRGVELAIGMEFFQRPFQSYLDKYVRGEVEEKAMLKGTQYYRRWRYDFRLYRPILAFAREHGIPLVALNAPTELVSQVSQHGWASVDDDPRTQLPVVTISPDKAYEQRLLEAYSMHPPKAGGSFERFVEVQLLWDEYMAESAALYLQEHPQRSLVVLSGSGHVWGGSGIPERLRSRVPLGQAIILSGRVGEIPSGAADLVLAEETGTLPRSGLLGLRIGGGEEGIVVERVRSASGSEASEISPGDRILSIAGEPVDTLEDVRLAMLDRLPGEQVWVELERGEEGGSVRRVSTYMELL